MSYVIAVLLGMFVGWAIPQPAWAKTIQDKITTWINSKV